MGNEAKLPRSRGGSPEPRAPRSAAPREHPRAGDRARSQSPRAVSSSSGDAKGAFDAGVKKLGGCWAAAASSKLPHAASDDGDASAASSPSPGKAGGGGMWANIRKSTAATEEAAKMKDTLTFDALFKRYELAKAFSLDSQVVRQDAKRVKKRLQDANRFLLNTESRGMQMWDLLTVIALVFTLLVSPYEIGYLDGYVGPGAMTLQMINHTVSIIFAIDLVLNFFRPFRDALSQKVKSHRRIAVAYLKGWFIVDVASTVPFDTIADLVSSLNPSADLTPSPHLKMIRLLRLLKLFRIVRASRVFARWADRIEHYISISHSSRTLLWWTTMLLTVVHWFICCWGLLAQLHGTQRSPELTLAVSLDDICKDSGACLPNDHPTSPQCVHPCLTACELRLLSEMNSWSEQLTFNQENWVCRAEAEGKVLPSNPDAMKNAKGAIDLARIYRYASLASIFGQMEPTNLAEYIMGYILAFGWLMMQNSFIGILCGSIADGDRHAKEYKQRMDELNYFLRDMQAPRELAVRAREHCRSTRGLFKKEQYVKLFSMMSPMLRGDLAQIMSLRTLENVWYFKTLEPDLLRALSEKLRPIGFARAERIYHEPRINIVTKGAAARGGKILTLDCYWGEDMIVTSEALKDTRYASALTYLELTTVTREDLEDCLFNYPKSERVIRVTALKMAMQRAGQIIAHHLQTRNKAKQLSTALARFDPKNKMVATHANAPESHESLLREMMTLVNGGKKLRVYNDKVGSIVDENETVIDDDYVRSVQQQYRISTEQHLLKIQEDMASFRAEQQKALEAERQHIAAERSAIAAERALYKKLAVHLNGSGGAGPGPRSSSPAPGACSSAGASLFSKTRGGGEEEASGSFTRARGREGRPRDSSTANGACLSPIMSPTGTATPPAHRSGTPGGAPGAGAAHGAAAMLAKAANKAAASVGSSVGMSVGGPVKMVNGVLMEKRIRRRKKEPTVAGGRSVTPPPPPPGAEPPSSAESDDSKDRSPKDSPSDLSA